MEKLLFFFFRKENIENKKYIINKENNKTMFKSLNTNLGNAKIDRLPQKCPYCHKTIIPDIIYGYKKQFNRLLDVFFACPDSNCNKTFIGEYQMNSTQSYYTFKNIISKGNIMSKKFSDSIKELSPSFVMIYNQAYYAEQEKLFEICGVGYRKALEFLIKDYAISKYPNDKENIEKKFLGKCINEYIDDLQIKKVAKRAVWLGNDETHYIRKWEGKNLNDLKKLIELTIHWIEMIKLTEYFENEMPD